MRVMDCPWGGPGRLPRGAQQETCGSLNPMPHIGQMGKLRSRGYGTRTRVLPAPPVPKAMTSQRIQGGQLGLKSVRVHGHTCAWGQGRCQGSKPTTSASAPGVGTANWSCAGSGVIRGNNCRAKARARARPALALLPLLCLVDRRRDTRLAQCAGRGPGELAVPSESLPSRPIAPTRGGRHCHHSVRPC